MEMNAWKRFISIQSKIVDDIYFKHLSLPTKQPKNAGHNYNEHGVELWIMFGVEFTDKRNIIHKLEQEGYLEILREQRDDMSGGTCFILDIKQDFHSLYKKLSLGDKIIKSIDDDDIWVQANIEGENIHLLIGEKDNYGKHVHLIIGKTGEIRIDEKDQAPADLLKKVVSITTNEEKKIEVTMEFKNN